MNRASTRLKIQSTLMVMFMVMMVMGLMLMVMVACSNGKDYRTTWNTPIPMVHTEAPAPTATISPTHTPVSISHDQAQEQIIDVLIAFNKMHNDFVVLMTTTSIFQRAVGTANQIGWWPMK